MFEEHRIPAGNSPWHEQYWAFVDAVGAIAQQVIDAKEGKATLLLNMQAKLPYSGWTQNVNANGHTINNLAAATSSSQPTTLSQVQSLITTGGNPSDVAITDLNKGTAVNGQYIGVVAGAVAGVTPPALNKAERMFAC